MIVDIHTHAYPEKVAQRARESLEESFKMKVVADPTVSSLLTSMDANGVDVSVVCGVATRPDQVRAINDWLFGNRSDRLRIFAALHPAYGDWQVELDRIREHADGIKFQPEFQDFLVDDEMLFPMYERMAALRLPVMFHCGEELSGTPVIHATPERIGRLHAAVPGLTIIAAHYGGFLMWDEVRRHLLGKDIYFDTSDFFRYLPGEQAIAMLAGHRPDRILFGTDFPLVEQGKDIGLLNGLDIPEPLRRDIFGGNAARLLGLPA